MLITLCAVLISVSIGFLYPSGVDVNKEHLIAIYLAGGVSILISTLSLSVFVLSPITQLEQEIVPGLTHLIHRDPALRIGRVYLFIFTFASFLAAAIESASIPHHILFFGWIIGLGIALDILRDSWKRYVHFLSPSFVVKRIAHEAQTSIQNDHRSNLLTDLDCLAEIGIRSVEQSKLALSSQTLQAFPPLIKTYLDSAKSIGHISEDIKKDKNLPGGDASSFIIFYLLQRLELIYDKSLRNRQETVCRQMIMSLGKIVVYSAQFDLSLVAFPTHFLTKFGLKAQQHHFAEVAVLTTSTLSEIAKTILTEVDITYAELQEPFQAIINGLAALARESFKKDKTSSIKVLLQPLIDLKALFNTEKMAHHRDTGPIVQQIDNVIEEFSVLEQVILTMPPLTPTV